LSLLPARRGGGPFEAAAAGLALLVGLLLRLAQYREVPWTAPNPDEWNWAWAGLSQLLGKPSTGWSLFWNLYPASVRSPSPPPFTEPLVHPYIDAPPLFSWMVGAVAWLDGDRTLGQVVHDPGYRLLAIALSLLTLLLAYLLGRLLLGVVPALIGLWLLATAPISVLMGRLVAAEHVLAVLLLLALLAVYGLRRTPTDRRLLALLLACCLLAPGFKAPGLVIGVSAAFLLATRRQFAVAAMAAAATVAGEAAVLGYTALLDWHTYTLEVAQRSSQLSGFTGYDFIVALTGFDGQHTVDGWWFLGWLGLAELAGRRRGDWDLLTVPAVVYLLAMVGFAAYYSFGYGWYRIAVMPLVYLAAARFLWLAVSELSVLRLALVGVVVMATAANYGPALGLRVSAVLLGGVILVAVLPGLAALAWPAGRRYAFGGAVALLALLAPLGALEVAALGSIYGH
jgi:Dolichyl-phosphate-mannose-protein mannosyltransferase